MDLIKIGEFIKEKRTQLGLTQRDLAEMLSISDKTVSKWETGNGLPDASLMMPLCDVLGVSVNELLSGEELSADGYQERAEENMVNLIKEKEESKKKIIIAVVVMVITLLSSLTLIMLSGLLFMDDWLRVLLICLGFIIIVLGVGVCCVLDRDAGYFECRNCGERFVPSMLAYVMGMHGTTWRRLKCPVCHKTTNCKKVLSKKDIK